MDVESRRRINLDYHMDFRRRMANRVFAASFNSVK
jgi:hypothetical protein